MAENFPDLILNDGSKPLEANKNDYFLVTITDLLPGKTYPVEFRWNYKDPTKKPDWGAVLKIVTPAYVIGTVQNVSASWVNEVFTLQFTHNRTLAENINVVSYKIKLFASDNTPAQDILIPVAGSSQKYTADSAKIISLFNFPVFELSGEIIAVDKDGNESTAVSFPLTTATTSLPAPVISVTAIQSGYSVSYTTPSLTQYPSYNNISIEEVESNSNTDPGSGYSSVFNGVASPAVVSRSNTAKRWVRARFFSKLNRPGPYSTAVSVTPIAAVVIDSTPPAAPASGSVTSGIDNSAGATIGFNAYLDISWSAVSDATLKGYRIRFRENGTSNPYSYVDSPGTGTTFRLTGLSIGTTYEVGVASYDEFNNTTASYTSLGTGQATGTPFIGKNITTVGYFGASATGDTGTFKFGYGVQDSGGTMRGLNFNSNNYWYINSSQSALFKLGGNTDNFISWDGGTFIVQGDIRARAGVFTGNVQVSTGSLYAGSSPSSGARLAIASTGLVAYDSNGIGTTSIYSNITAGGDTFTTTAATIGGWKVTDNSISKVTGSSATLILDAVNNNIRAYVGTEGTSTNNRIVMQAPTSASSYVLYAGNATAASAAFSVTAAGALTATSATITGSITSTTGSIGGWTIGPTTITGGNTTLNSNGNIVISSGTKTTTISNSASISLVDTSDGFLSGGGIQIQSGTDFASFGAIGISLGPTVLFTNRVAPEYSVNATILATTGPEIHIASPSSNTPIYHNARFGSTNSPFWTGYYSSSSADTGGTGTYLSTSGAIISRRDDNIPIFAHRYDSITPYSGAVQYEVFRGILQATSRGSIFLSMTGNPALAVPSDYRLKENIRDYTESINVIKSKRLRIFNLKDDPTKTDTIGFIAHEFGEDNSELVIGAKDAIDSEGNPEYQSIAFTNLIPYLTGALKEIILRVESLETRLDALEG